MEYYQELLKMYLNYCGNNTPIFIEEIKRFFKGLSKSEEEYKNTIKKVYVSINRLVRKGYLKSFSDGVYYKGQITKEDVIKKKYIENKDDGVFGYYVEDFIISNMCKKRSYYNKTLGVWVRKPRIEITNENYKYLKLLDKIRLGRIDSVNIYKSINELNLDYKELFMYSKLIKNKKTIMCLYDIL